MKLLADKDIKGFFLGIVCVMAVLLLLSQMALWMQVGTFSLPLFALSLLASGGVFGICFRYFRKENDRTASNALENMLCKTAA